MKSSMKITTCPAIAAMMMMLFAQEASAAEQVVKGFESFKLVRTRNIFDPNRQPIQTESAQRPPPPPRPPAPNQLALNGAMVTADTSFAFFGGTRDDYRKVLGVGATIAGFNIKSIAPSQVELERNGKTIVLAVGQQISPEAEAPTPTTQTQPPPEQAQPAPPAAGAAPATDTAVPPPGGEPAASAAPGAPADRNEILRRMMQRRQQETSR
jgi:type II secretory pathway component PulC